MNKEKDAIYVHADFHLTLEIQKMGHHKCKNVGETKALIRQMDQKAKDFEEKIGTKVDEMLLARTLWQAMDQETLEMAGNKGIALGSMIAYWEVKEFAIQRYEDLQARSSSPKEQVAAMNEKEKKAEGDQGSYDSLYTTSSKGKGANGGPVLQL